MDATMKEKIIQLLSTYMIHPFYSSYLLVRSIPYYLQDKRIFRTDLDLFLYYFFRYPFHLFQYDCHKTGKSPSELTYGETPYFTLEKVLDRLSIDKNDVFVDLGCGKGKTVFFVSSKYGIKSAGIDIMPTYIDIANTLKQRWGYQDIKFIEKDLLLSKVPKASIVMMSLTCFDEKTRLKISNHTETFSLGTKVISISYPLDSEQYKAIDCIEGHFSWGKSTVYIQEKC